MLDLTGKVAIVTGAGSVGPGWGNGKATATLLARQGASVFLLDINAEAVAETQKIIEGEGGICAVHACNMLVAADVQEMVQACLNKFKRIDILVNNVGGSEPGNAVTMEEEAFDRQIAFNLKTAFLGCKYVIPVMESQGKGAIVNISSVPGLMHTPLVEFRLARQIAGNDASALIASRNAQVPMGKMGTGWDVAHAVLFLVSDEAGFITGTEIVVDGGMIAGLG
jgi:NAD(P)-dependent dehydrogenase (short-subunit alcohol dehydrogenase family)